MPFKDPVKRAEYHKAYNKKWLAENKEHAKAFEKAYLSRSDVKARRAKNARLRRYKNPEKDKAQLKKWRKQNHDYVIQRNKEYRARSYNAAGSASREQIKARVDFFGGICVYCKVKAYECIDHRIPLSRGGSNWPSNLVPACLKCNSSKRDRTPAEFKRYLLTRK